MTWFVTGSLFVRYSQRDHQARDSTCSRDDGVVYS